MNSGTRDTYWMQRALELARGAAARDEVPVGAVIVMGDYLVAEAATEKESAVDPLGHAELTAINRAAKQLGRWRLNGCTLYVTLEPCLMCAGAILHTRFDRVVYAAKDPKAGAVESLFQVLSDPRLKHNPQVSGGLMADESSALLSEFFRQVRARKIK